MPSDIRVIHKGYLRHVDGLENSTKRRYVVFGQYKDAVNGRNETYFVRIHDSDKEKILIKELPVCKDSICGLDSGVVNTTRRRLLWLFQRQDVYLAIVTSVDTVVLQSKEKRSMEQWKEKLKRELCSGKDYSWVLRVTPGQGIDEKKVTVHLTGSSVAMTSINPPRCLVRYANYECVRCLAISGQLEIHFNHLGKSQIYTFNTTRNREIADVFTGELSHLSHSRPTESDRNLPIQIYSRNPVRSTQEQHSQHSHPLRPAGSIDMLNEPYVPETTFTERAFDGNSSHRFERHELDRQVEPPWCRTSSECSSGSSSQSAHSDHCTCAQAGSDLGLGCRVPLDHAKLPADLYDYKELHAGYIRMIGDVANTCNVNILAQHYQNVCDDGDLQDVRAYINTLVRESSGHEYADNLGRKPPRPPARNPGMDRSNTGERDSEVPYWSAHHICFTLDLALKQKIPLHQDTLKLPKPVRTQLCFDLYPLHEGTVKGWQDLAEEIGLKQKAISLIQAFHQHHPLAETAAELVLRHWQSAYSKYGAGTEECPWACDQETLIYLLREKLEREDLVSLVKQGGQ